jgi:hypothetical protein
LVNPTALSNLPTHNLISTNRWVGTVDMAVTDEAEAGEEGDIIVVVALGARAEAAVVVAAPRSLNQRIKEVANLAPAQVTPLR